MKAIILESVVPGRRLGRLIHHDPRSRGFLAARAATLRTVRHKRNVPIFDQGDLGSCTGNAACGMVSTAPFGQTYTERDAVAVYSEATKIDNIAGHYPPTDTGSSGLAVMRALKARGVITGYGHTFSADHALRALVLGPGICGMTWLDGCDEPNADGVVTYTGGVRGGHEVELVGLDVAKELVWFANSWGPSWGLDGYFAMSWGDFARALADRGDCTFPVLP